MPSLPHSNTAGPPLGAHMSVAGGIHNAIDHITRVGGTALQIFTRNQRQWNAKPLQADEIKTFKDKREKAGLEHVASHASYLINLASPKQQMLNNSIRAMADELVRCQQLGIKWVVVHPGSHGGSGLESGLERVAKSVDAVIELAGPSVTSTILLETTAGQGTSLGAAFDELEFILSRTRFPERLGICVDTCHIFAAGYDISDSIGYEKTIYELEKTIGLERVKMFHLNDSKKEAGSRIDRHEHIGRGRIGLDGFACLLNDERFRHIPMVLETPKSKDLAEDVENLKTLKGLMNSK